MGSKLGEDRFSDLKAFGYESKNTFEDLVLKLTPRMPRSKNGFDWWYDFKDKNLEKGISFEDALISEIKKDLEEKNGK